MQQQANVQTSMPQNTQNNMEQPTSTSQVTSVNQAITSQAQAPSQQNQQLANRQNIWHGLLEWTLKPKNPNDPQKITKQVPCHVSTNPSKDGELELKADDWPPKLLMQLMPKQLIGNIGVGYLRNSKRKRVLFHPQKCEASESLAKVMSSGFAGCVHFQSSPANNSVCDIKVLILFYITEKRAYLGFIPNDQVAFMHRLRKVMQQQKNIEMPRPGMSQGGGQLNQRSGASGNTMGSGMLGAPVQRAPFENQLQVERQQNLEKINQLKQTLEAAQQQEQQYKNHLERISHMKTVRKLYLESLPKFQSTRHWQRTNGYLLPLSLHKCKERTLPPHKRPRKQPQYRQQLMGMRQIYTAPRPSMGQMQGGGNNLLTILILMLICFNFKMCYMYAYYILKGNSD